MKGVVSISIFKKSKVQIVLEN